MKIFLPIFALLLGIAVAMATGQGNHSPALSNSAAVVQVVAVPAAHTPEVLAVPNSVEETPAEKILHRVRDELQRRPAVTARIRFQLDLFTRRMIGAGTYFQSGDAGEKRTRWELRVQQGQTPITWNQVCDGRFVWTAADTIGEPLLTRLDLRVIKQRQDRLTDGTGLSDGQLWIWAGLPQLLHALNEFYTWDQAMSGTMDNGRTPAWELRGRWKPSQLSALWPEGKDADGGFNWGRLPSQLPGNVTLYIRQSDCFPIRIEYGRPADNGDGKPQENSMSPTLMVEFTDIDLQTIPAEEVFRFQPSRGQEMLDVTENVLQSLGLNR